MYVNLLGTFKNQKIVRISAQRAGSGPWFILIFRPLASVTDPTDGCPIAWIWQTEGPRQRQVASIPAHLHFQEKNINLPQIALREIREF